MTKKQKACLIKVKYKGQKLQTTRRSNMDLAWQYATIVIREGDIWVGSQKYELQYVTIELAKEEG